MQRIEVYCIEHPNGKNSLKTTENRQCAVWLLTVILASVYT